VREQPNLSRVRSRAELLSLQRAFARAIRVPLRKGDHMLRTSVASEMIRANARSKPHQRLEFYAQQYWWRILDSFDQDFPLVKRVISRREYAALRLDYLTRFPSQSYTLRDLGSRFPQYLARCKKLSPAKRSLASDAAKVDWARIVAFDAAEYQAISEKQIHSQRFIDRTLTLQPHVQLLHLRYDLSRHVRSREAARLEVASNTSMRRGAAKTRKKQGQYKRTSCCFVLHRFEESIHIKALSAHEFKILRAFQGGLSLRALSRTQALRSAIARIDLAQAFAEWRALGWLYETQRSVMKTCNSEKIAL
jgi:hypothetical protein